MMMSHGFRCQPMIGRISRGEALLVPVLLIDAEFEVGAVEELAIGCVRDREERAQLEAVVRAAQIRRMAVERQVQSRLEPRRHAVGPLGDAVQ